MALGSANRQQMAPAQFVAQVNPEGLFRPGDYSRLGFDASVPLEGYVRLAQDAMQKQAAYEAAYQEQQNNLGWELVDRVQSAVSKGQVTAGQFENMRAQAITNRLNERFGDEERQAELDQKKASTREAQARSSMTEFDLGLKRKYGEEEARSLVDQRRAQIESTQATTEGTRQNNQLNAEFGRQDRQADLESKQVTTESAKDTLSQAILEREKRKALVGIASDESRTIHKLYELAKNGEEAAYNRLFDYAIPADLLEDPKLAAQLKEQLDSAQRNAAASKTIELSKKSRLGYEQFAQKLYTDGPKGQALAARVVGILNQTPGFLTADQTEAIQSAYEVYKTRINPGTQVRLPEIIDTLEARREARETDRQASVRQPLSDSTTNATIRAWTTVLQDMAASQDQKDMALAILETVARRSPELLDPRILTMIQLKRASQENAGTTKPNAAQDNKANFNRFD